MYDYNIAPQMPLQMRDRQNLGIPTREVSAIPRALASVSGGACELLQSQQCVPEIAPAPTITAPADDSPAAALQRAVSVTPDTPTRERHTDRPGPLRPSAVR